MSAERSDVLVKARLEEIGQNDHEIKRFHMESISSVESLKEKISSAFSNQIKNGFKVTWTDSEGDRITISNDDDLEEALRSSSDGVLKVDVIDERARKGFGFLKQYSQYLDRGYSVEKGDKNDAAAAETLPTTNNEDSNTQNDTPENELSCNGELERYDSKRHHSWSWRHCKELWRRKCDKSKDGSKEDSTTKYPDTYPGSHFCIPSWHAPPRLRPRDDVTSFDCWEFYEHPREEKEETWSNKLRKQMRKELRERFRRGEFPLTPEEFQEIVKHYSEPPSDETNQSSTEDNKNGDFKFPPHRSTSNLIDPTKCSLNIKQGTSATPVKLTMFGHSLHVPKYNLKRYPFNEPKILQLAADICPFEGKDC